MIWRLEHSQTYSKTTNFARRYAIKYIVATCKFLTYSLFLLPFLNIVPLKVYLEGPPWLGLSNAPTPVAIRRMHQNILQFFDFSGKNPRLRYLFKSDNSSFFLEILQKYSAHMVSGFCSLKIIVSAWFLTKMETTSNQHLWNFYELFSLVICFCTAKRNVVYCRLWQIILVQ